MRSNIFFARNAEVDAVIIWSIREWKMAPIFGLLAFLSWAAGIERVTAVHTEWDKDENLLSCRNVRGGVFQNYSRAERWAAAK